MPRRHDKSNRWNTWALAILTGLPLAALGWAGLAQAEEDATEIVAAAVLTRDGEVVPESVRKRLEESPS